MSLEGVTKKLGRSEPWRCKETIEVEVIAMLWKDHNTNEILKAMRDVPEGTLLWDPPEHEFLIRGSASGAATVDRVEEGSWIVWNGYVLRAFTAEEFQAKYGYTDNT